MEGIIKAPNLNPRNPGPHHGHEILKVWKYMYHGTVSLDDMNKYFDCSEIRPYICNGQRVLYLDPQTFCHPTSCNISPQKLHGETIKYLYCSISSKVQKLVPTVIPDENQSAVPNVIPDENQNSPRERQESPTQEGQESPPLQRQEENPKPVSFRKRSRKGTPHRAPFF
ncbi:hypothetical protein PIB30_044518 [Stylosanthes scabra]|uniref:Uncharacterized protein n=1 Tax=Stylosanthes scabra TaxID=79078 RepID=A0ABU6QFK2_9FABA|nr:hypothetical protein [Stylosanthes scabra]